MLIAVLHFEKAMRILGFLAIALNCLNLNGQTIHPPLEISHLTADCYVYTTYNDPGNGSLFPSNSMYVVTADGVVLIDTPWDSTQFQPLLDSIAARHQKKVIMCISTHFHADRTAGLEYYRHLGIKTYTTRRTDEFSKIRNEKRSEFIIDQDTTFHVSQLTFQTYYPGQGHSPDNIVVWLPKEKVLYGGCFVKSTEASGLGNLGDANPVEWVKSVKKVERKFRKPEFIIPGHQSWESKKPLNHTRRLLKIHLKTTQKS